MWSNHNLLNMMIVFYKLRHYLLLTRVCLSENCTAVFSIPGVMNLRIRNASLGWLLSRAVAALTFISLNDAVAIIFIFCLNWGQVSLVNL
jgi:hypothetical protein